MPTTSVGKVFLVGAGPGDPGLLTLRAAEVLRGAEVLLYDALASDAVVALAPRTCERIFVGKRGGDHAMAQSEIEALTVRKARQHKLVVRLKGGDPFVFGRGGEEAQMLAAAGIDFEIVPGISSALAAPAYAGIPLTHRDHNTAFTVATGHEDPGKPASTLDWASLAVPHRTLVLLMAIGNLGEIVRELIEHGSPAETPVAIVQNGTRPDQRTVVGTLATIARDVERAGIGSPAVAVVGDVVSLRESIAWFDTSPLFGKRVLITRPAHQNEELARALYARGAEPIAAPTISIEPPDDVHAAHRAIDELASYEWLVFSSSNAVDAFFDRLAALDTDARYIGKVKIAAIGAKTSERLRFFGVRADLTPAEYVGEELAVALIKTARPNDRVLIFRAAQARDVLPQMLTDAGLRPTVVAAYRTAFVEDAGFPEKVARADAIAFTSASTVAGFASLLGGDARAIAAARGKTVACIGPVTARAARDAGLTVDVVATDYTAAGLVGAIESHFTQTEPSEGS